MSAALTSAPAATGSLRSPQRLDLLSALRLWLKRARERHELTQLTDRELHDFGVSPSEAIAEMRKPFWKA
jgi:uncharacterized protein YjiS (DUF1127 family)